MVISYDSIEYFKNNISLGITCLPEYSGREIRQALAKHLGIDCYDEMWFHRTNGNIVKIKITELIKG